MVKTCCAPNCRNKSKKPGTSFFCFPRDQGLRQEWIRRVNKANFHPTRHTVLCSDHFHADSFLSESVPEFLQLIGLEQRPARRRLKNGALPTLFKLTANGWEEGNGEEDGEDVEEGEEEEEEEEERRRRRDERRDEEGMEEESEEETRFVIHMDVAEEDAEPEPGSEEFQNPCSQPGHPTHYVPTSQPLSQPYLTTTTSLADHVDEQGDNNNNSNNNINNNKDSSSSSNNNNNANNRYSRPRRACRNSESAGDACQKDDQTPDDDILNKEHQDGKDFPDKTDDTNITENTDEKEGLADDDSDADTIVCGEKGTENEEGEREEPLFTIESVRTLSKDDLNDLTADGEKEDKAEQSRTPSSRSDKEANSPDRPAVKKRKASRKSPPFCKSSPGFSARSSLPFPAASHPHTSGPLLCRIDPAFCKFQPVFEVPFASSPTFFHRTADSMVADTTSKTIAQGGDDDGDAQDKDASDSCSSQIPIKPGSKPASPVPSPDCTLPCCTGKSGTAAIKPLNIKEELTDADFPSQPDRAAEPPLPDSRRNAPKLKLNPGKILYRSVPISIPGGGQDKKSSVPYRSEPINIPRSTDTKGVVPYRSEPIRKLTLPLPSGLALLERKEKGKKNVTKDSNWSKALFPSSRKPLHNGGPMEKAGTDMKGEGVKSGGGLTIRTRSFSAKSSATSGTAASRRKISVVDTLSGNHVSTSHHTAVPVSLTGLAVPQSSLSPTSNDATSASRSEGKLSEGAIFIRQDHVMADLLDVFKHSAHRVHRATIFRLCHNLSATTVNNNNNVSNNNISTSTTSATCAQSGRGGSEPLQENWETVEHKRLFSLFWKEAVRVYFDGHLQKVPRVNSQPACSDVPYVLGKVLRHGLVLCGYWPVVLAPACAVTVFTGDKCSPELLRHSLNKAMFEFEVQALQDLQDSAKEGGARFQEVRQERRVVVVVEAYGGAQCQVPAVPEEVEAFVTELAAYYLYCQPYWWLREMRRGFLSITEHTRADQDYLSAMTEGEVVEMYRTLHPSPRTFLLRLTFRMEDAKMSSSQQRLKNFLERCLLRLSPDQMVKLLKRWSHADCLLDDTYHVQFVPPSSAGSSSLAVPPFFRPPSNTLVLSSAAGSMSFEYFEVMFHQLLNDCL